MEKHSTDFKAKVALDAIREKKTLSQMVCEYEVSPSQIIRWRVQAIESISLGFARKNEAEAAKKVCKAEIGDLRKQIEKMRAELDWLKKKIKSEIPKEERIKWIDGECGITKQCDLLGLNRSGIYYKKAGKD